MWCRKCDNDLNECACKDVEEKLRWMSSAEGPIAAKWCKGCDKHYSLCECRVPQWTVRVNGEFHDEKLKTTMVFGSNEMEPS